MIYKNSYYSMQQELDVINLLKTVKKLKAGVSVLMEDKDQILMKAKELYMESCSIPVLSTDMAEHQ